MSNDDDEPAAAANTAEAVGYRRPPTAHQFKPGQSGNRSGKRKGTKNTKTLLAEMLGQKLTLRIDGKPQRMSVWKAIVMVASQLSAKKNLKAFAVLEEIRKAAVQDGEIPEGQRGGYLVVNEKCKTLEEWEARHGEAMRNWQRFDAESD